nr:GH32 C-terminal domain-containing protein [Staphylococcus lugdunensis]
KLQMYIDTSSVELFINDGEAVFTERFYSETAPKIWVSADSPIKLNTHIYELAENAIQFD